MRIQELGSKIRKARRVRGLTQAQVAEAAGVSRATVNRLESGTYPDLGVRKVQAILDQLGLTLVVQPAEPSVGPNYVQMACATASVSFKTELTEDDLVVALLSGRVPPRKRPHFRTLLDEASPALLHGLIEELGKWAKPGRVEKNIVHIATEVGASREIESWLKTG